MELKKIRYFLRIVEKGGLSKAAESLYLTQPTMSRFLAKLEEERGNPQYLPETGKTSKERSASNEMCNFLILNISSLQLIPVNIIAYRSQYGSVNPAAIVGAGIVATGINTLAGILFCKIKGRKRIL